MNHKNLLDCLTEPSPNDVTVLVTAAAARARFRRTVRKTAAASLAVMAAAGTFGALLRPQSQPRAAGPVTSPPVEHVTPLTRDELLESFGNQPVALVEYPDGSQRLLTVVR